jgi:hypothetical protein
VAQLAGDRRTDPVAGDFASGQLEEFFFDPIDDGVDLADRDGAFAAGEANAFVNLLAVVVLEAAVLFDDLWEGLFDVFVGGEPTFTAETFAATSNGVSRLGVAGVDYAIFEVAAEGTTHQNLPVFKWNGRRRSEWGQEPSNSFFSISAMR